MIKNKKIWMSMFSLVAALTLTACAGGEEETSPSQETTQDESMDNMDHSNMDMGTDSDESMDNMDHSSSGEVPEGLKVAENPTFEVGSKAM